MEMMINILLPSATMASTQQPPNAEAMKVLESYSDMMAEMVAAKMMKKMENTATSSSSQEGGH